MPWVTAQTNPNLYRSSYLVWILAWHNLNLSCHFHVTMLVILVLIILFEQPPVELINTSQEPYVRFTDILFLTLQISL